MNAAQRKILWGALAAVVVTLLFPPFVIVWGAGATFGLGFGFILSWPEMSGNEGYVHVELLLSEWIAIAIIYRILWVLKRDPKQPTFPGGVLTLAINRYADITHEVAHIKADAIMRAAEIEAEALRAPR